MPNVAAALDEPNDDSRRVPFSPKGCVGSYIHAGGKIGVLVELNCKSDFVARTDDLQELIKDIAMHIAAAEPKFIRREDVTSEAYEKEKDIYRAQAAGTGKPPEIVERIVEGRMAKFYEEVCLLEQPFVKEPGITIGQLITRKADKLDDKICVRRFVRFKVGDAGETIAIGKPEQETKAE
jgi:elongation factor Ts